MNILSVRKLNIPDHKSKNHSIMDRVKDKVIIVTGGSLGIGKASCELLAKGGAKVALTDIKDDEGQKVADEITSNGGKAKYWHMNVADEEEVKNTFKDINDTFGGIDVLVNNAGIAGKDKKTHELTSEEWDKVIDVNVKGVFLCTKYAIPHFKDKGNIINLSSIYGIISSPDIPPYHASKGAVRLMTKTDALLYANDNIRVNSVHPGFIWTPLVENLAKDTGQDPEEFRKQLDKQHPIGHVGEPNDIAWGILFLASDESKFMTGSELVIDGGYTCK
ncbi:MAG: glucose 1-dehydrogenase [Bacteroidales bacterium]|nr:glucose 1-dehydrogenase [Bacteroidales bacterium]